MTHAITITTTCDNRETLDQIAKSIIDLRLAACCQIGGPVTSIYRWEGKTEQAQEWVLSIKSLSNVVTDIVVEIQRLHTYDEPEIIAVQIAGGSESYLAWIHSQVGHDGNDKPAVDA